MRFFRLQNVALALSLLATGGVFMTQPVAAFGQATAVNGSIQGAITDPSGAAVAGAQVKIISNDTGTVKTFTTDASGLYVSGPLIPGSYTVDVVANGFSEVKSKTIVQIGVATNGNIRLKIAEGQEIIEVSTGAVQVNTEQSNVGDVLTTEQIQTLPVNGRNFLDLAQLEPGVQLQSGDSFDPTKAGYSAVSFSGVSGRTTRILLDGQDITDETVGTTILNVSEGAIDQFQMNRSNGDVSGEIGSSGSLTVSTRSGSNQIHGELFGNFQDYRAGFASGQGSNPPFQRDQFGGSIGGPILKDKLFLFANAERIKQASSSTIGLPSIYAPLEAEYPTVPSPYKLTYSTGRMDYNGPWGVHYFARIAYDVDAAVASMGYGYSNYANRDNTPAVAGGADFITGKFTHSIRGSYEKFHNFMADATGAGVYRANPNLWIYDGTDGGMYTGPNYLAPQATFQSEKQLRYDGSWAHGKHSVRYGGSINRILQAGMANFYGSGAGVRYRSGTFIPNGTNTDYDSASISSSNLLDLFYAQRVRFGNNLGYSTNDAGFGLPAGAMDDWRVGMYVADSWKITPQLTANAGIRYLRDTGRSDSKFDPIPCSEISSSIATAPCSGSSLILDQFEDGLGKRVKQPNFDFAPQLGFAYSVDPAGRTVVHGSIGAFRESAVFNAIQFDTLVKEKSGLLNAEQDLCSSGYTLNMPGTGLISTWTTDGVSESLETICGQSLRVAAPKFVAMQTAYHTAASGQAVSNPNFIGNTLAILDSAGSYVFDPKFRTPYSLQFNFGVQRQLGNGIVVTADYVHQAIIHIQQLVDVNHVGDASYLNKSAAENAISTTLAKYGAASIDEAIADGATINKFAAAGLDSEFALHSGQSILALGKTTDKGAAFAGKNPSLGTGYVSRPAGRSGYDALQLNLRQQQNHPMRGVVSSNFEVSYSLSRFLTTSNAGSDQFFGSYAWDYNQPTRFIGYGGLDHRHNLAFGGSTTFKYGPRASLIAHFRSAAPTSLTLDNSAGNTAQIFITDVTGDGTTGDLLPGTNPGAYERAIHGKDLNKAIANYNSRYAGQVTPAGQALIDAGLMTYAQLVELGGVQQKIASVPGRPFENPMFKSIDLSLSYPQKLKFISKTAAIEPIIAFYNVGNFANFGRPSGQLQNIADKKNTNYVNGPWDSSVTDSNRITRGAGTFDQGGPRTIEYQLKFTF